MLRALLLALSLALTALTPAMAQPAPARPAWNQLTAQQREALAPLAADWESFDADRKRKWLEIAARYPTLPAESQQRLHQRMAEFARLTPEQKREARDNFKKLYELPVDERQARVQQFQELTPEQKRALAERAQQEAAKAPAPPPRRGNPPQ